MLVCVSNISLKLAILIIQLDVRLAVVTGAEKEKKVSEGEGA